MFITKKITRRKFYKMILFFISGLTINRWFKSNSNFLLEKVAQKNYKEAMFYKVY